MRSSQPPYIVLYRILFLGNGALFALALIAILLGAEMLNLLSVSCGSIGLGCAVALRRYGYERWHYQEIENAFDHVQATAESAYDDSISLNYQRLQTLFETLDNDTLPIWDRQITRQEIQQLLQTDPTLLDTCDEETRARHPYFF